MKHVYQQGEHEEESPNESTKSSSRGIKPLHTSDHFARMHCVPATCASVHNPKHYRDYSPQLRTLVLEGKPVETVEIII